MTAALGWHIAQVKRRLRLKRLKAEALGHWYFRNAERKGERCWVIGRPLVTTPRITIGDDFLLWSIHRTTHLGGEGHLEIGNNVFVNSGAVILAFEHIILEDHAGIASEVFLSDSDNHALGTRPVRQAPIRICEGAWVATRAMVLPGVTIGPRAVVAAGAVVTADVEADTLVAGIPAKPIRRIEYPPHTRSAWRGDALQPPS